MNSVSQTFSVAPMSLWIGFIVAIIVLLIVDLYIHTKKASSVSKKTAIVESIIWIMIALGFNGWFASQYGSELGVEFLIGYLVEKSLSVDNLFIMLLVFSSFHIPAKYQHRILFYGILGVIIFRGIFILIGAALIHSFSWILYIFGLILIVTAIKFIREKEGHQVHLEDNWLLKLVQKIFPTTTTISGEHFFVRENNVLKMTPLFLALLVIEATDLVFAVDSIPAVFAITQDTFVAFASNILAVLGLRSLYFVLADLVGKLYYLKQGLAAILAFIGTKMLIVEVYHIPSGISLSIILGILALAGFFSYLKDKKIQSK